MPFLNFFIPYSYHSLFREDTHVNYTTENFMEVFAIYLDNPTKNIYFPFKKIKVLDFNILKLVIDNLGFLSNFIKTQSIFLNYNTANCNVNYEDFNIKSLDDHKILSDEWVNQDIDITLLRKPVLIKLDDNKYFFDFEINQKFLDSSVLVELFKMYKLKKDDWKKYSRFFRPFFNTLADESGKLFHYDPSYIQFIKGKTTLFGIFIIGIDQNKNIFQNTHNSLIFKNNRWVNPYLESFYDNNNNLLCNKYLSCNDNGHNYSCKILSNCIYNNKRFLFGASLPFFSVIDDFENWFNFTNFLENRIDILNLDNEKITEEWLTSKINLVINKFSVNIKDIKNINVWLNNYSDLNELNYNLIEKYKLTFLNWSFYKFLFSNNNNFIMGNYLDNILKDNSNLKEFYLNKLD